jgi:ubiquitin-like protein 4
MKSSSPTVPLSGIDTSKTSIFDLKNAYSTKSSIAVSKIKVLWNKKPVSDSKTIGEVIGQDAGTEVEFSIMIMGGGVTTGGTPVTNPPAVAPSEAEKGLGAGPAAQGPSGKEVVASSEFWEDLKGFVVQRIRDEQEGQRLVSVFKAAWEKDR